MSAVVIRALRERQPITWRRWPMADRFESRRGEFISYEGIVVGHSVDPFTGNPRVVVRERWTGTVRYVSASQVVAVSPVVPLGIDPWG
ncbi:hypothetical protein AB0876_31565 [Mycobacterium sp. NPDC049093]